MDELSILNVNPGDENNSGDQAVSTGIHPWYIRQYNIPEVLEKIRAAASYKNVLAIGECGLDRLVNIPLAEQEQIFIEQIRIAEVVNKPVIVHCVKAFDDLIRIKNSMSARVPFIVHGYNNNMQIALQLLKNDFYISFGKALLIDDSNAQKVFMTTDPQHCFFETDDAAIPIRSIFTKAAALRNTTVEDLKEETMSNFKRLFNHE